MITRRMFGAAACAAALAICDHGTAPAHAADAGQTAPDFKLPSTVGSDISLKDFRGKKWVLLEFYGADFSPT